MGRVCLLIVENPQRCAGGTGRTALSRRRGSGGRACAEGSAAGAAGAESRARIAAHGRTWRGACARFSLGALSEDQTAAYVAHRLRAAGATDPDALMPSTLMPQIHACSGGVPSQINRLCEHALAHARRNAAPQVTAAALDRAIDELGCTRRRLPATSVPQRRCSGDAERPAKAGRQHAGSGGSGDHIDRRSPADRPGRGSRRPHRFGLRQPLSRIDRAQTAARTCCWIWAAPTDC